MPSNRPKTTDSARLPSFALSCATLTATFTLQGAQRAIRDAPDARQCCNPPQSAICTANSATSPQG
eukprot:10248888-Alexandrium_andersonii.AAC.1